MWGVLAAILSSGLGGTAVGATRYLAGSLDPVAIGVLRFGGGVLVLAPLALWRGEPWPPRRDWPAVAGLGLLFFGLFPLLFNAALAFTTAARGALALSTLPLLTMLAGALLRVEPPTRRKTVGVLVAIGGVVLALGTSLQSAPPGAWRGDLLMVAAALCMALYNVWSRPFIARAGPVTFAASGMGVGALALALLALGTGSLRGLAGLPPAAWLAAIYLAAVCGALIFFLWAYALGRVAPTVVAVSVAVNPVTASIFGLLLLDEPVSARLAFGLVMVLAGIAIASGLRLRRRAAA
jgi:drug/metabolite transporter (DMT)-like permease